MPGALIALIVLATSVPPLRAQDDPDPSPSPSPFRISEDVLVRAVRADQKTPVTRTELRREELEQRNYGQEMPVLLKGTPGVTFSSDTGTSSGYSYLYIRGIPQTRINMTLDGVPLNEPEDQALYFVDFGDFTSSLESIEIQRGVGTSPVGTASYGGAVSFESIALAEKPQAAAEVGLGSFDTRRASLGGQSGRFGPGLAAYARGTYKDTDGFRDHSGVRQRSLFFGGSHQGERSFLKLFGFAGREQTQLAFLATEKDVLERDLRFNAMAPEENDRFGQDFVQAQWTRALGLASSLSVQGYRTSAGGDYRIWADADHSALYQYNLDWRALRRSRHLHASAGRFKTSGGVHANDFDSDHARDVVGSGREYANRGHKSELSGFARASYDVAAVHLYGDAQLRHARFRYAGDLPLGSVDWTFLNPRLGARFDAGRGPGTVRVGRTRLARTGALGHARRRGQCVALVRAVGREARARGRCRDRHRLSANPAPAPGQRLRDGVPQRDRANRRALGDRPAAAPQRGRAAIAAASSSTCAGRRRAHCACRGPRT